MTLNQIVKYIDDGANFYIDFFGNAKHMEKVDNSFYSFIRPLEGEHGINFVFDVRLSELSREVQAEKINEIKALNMPVWLNLFETDEIFKQIFNKDKIHGQTEFSENDEILMAMLSNEKPSYQLKADGSILIEKVNTEEKFALWTEMTNGLMHGGYQDIHPVNHYHLCRNGLINCYTLYKNDAIVAVAATLNNNGIVSLEFVSTVPDLRRQGLAKAICCRAIDDAFADNAKIITLRAINLTAAKLYKSLGFCIYNYAV